MRNLLNPRWLFIVNTLPIAALLVLFLGQFNIIKTLLDEKSIRLWMSFGSTLIILGVLNFVYTAYSVYKKQNVSALYAIAALLCYIPFIYLYGYCLDQIIPFDIPQWMISGNIFLYVGTFLMPTLAYSLFVLVSHFTPETKEYRAWVNFLIAVSIPVSGYLFSQIVLPLWQPVAREFSIHALLILIIATTIVFLFFTLYWYLLSRQPLYFSFSWSEVFLFLPPKRRLLGGDISWFGKFRLRLCFRYWDCW